MNDKICDNHNNTSAANKCASALTSYLNEPLLKAHVTFVHGYHEAWWNHHDEWMVERDGRSKEPGFRSHHMATRFFIMSSTLKKLRTDWRLNAAFGKYLLA